MKKRIALLLAIALMTAACGQESSIGVGHEATETANPQTSYFPLNKGRLWIYSTEFRQGSTLNAPTGEMIYEIIDGAKGRYNVRVTAQSSLQVFSQSAILQVNADGSISMPVFTPDGGDTVIPTRAELTYGLRWTDPLTGASANVASAEELLPTKAGTFPCVRIESTTFDPSGNIYATSWFARGVGLVRLDLRTSVFAQPTDNIQTSYELKLYK